MTHGRFRVPTPANETVRPYAPGDPERESLKKELERQASEVVEIPAIIGGEEVRTGKVEEITMPHDKGHVIAKVHLVGEAEVKRALDAAEAARRDWEGLPWEERAAVFLRAAELLSTTWRDRVNAATMLGQSKTAHQAEIDSACELIDFWRFNPHYAEQVYAQQPQSADRCWNRSEHRPLDGFVFAITPFNFTSIAGNLPTAPALMGNTCLWKPSSTGVAGSWQVMALLLEAGLPPGVINFLPGHGAEVGDPVLADSRLGGVHFTGSTATFQRIWRTIGENIAHYGQYPRLVGETGGKDFVIAHPSANAEQLAVALSRGAFEYQGQKCSAASRAYVPKSLWNEVRDRIAGHLSEMGVGDVRDFRNFMGAVIDGKAFADHREAIDAAKNAGSKAEIVIGGEYDDSTGWFVKPTVIQAHDPKYDTMERELFGPILTVHVYDDAKWRETLQLCDETSPYALTGAVFATERKVIREATDALRFAAGNFYVNDKPTGAVVSQQPFGGSRASGTNDKAGSILNLLRWVSPRSIKENLAPPADWRYPYMGAE